MICFNFRAYHWMTLINYLLTWFWWALPANLSPGRSSMLDSLLSDKLLLQRANSTVAVAIMQNIKHKWIRSTIVGHLRCLSCCKITTLSLRRSIHCQTSHLYSLSDFSLCLQDRASGWHSWLQSKKLHLHPRSPAKVLKITFWRSVIF